MPGQFLWLFQRKHELPFGPCLVLRRQRCMFCLLHNQFYSMPLPPWLFRTPMPKMHRGVHWLSNVCTIQMPTTLSQWWHLRRSQREMSLPNRHHKERRPLHPCDRCHNGTTHTIHMGCHFLVVFTGVGHGFVCRFVGGVVQSTERKSSGQI